MNFMRVRTSKAFQSIVLLFLFAFLVGCGDSNVFESLGDDSSREAKTEAALMAMDDGDYNSALSILLALNDSNPGDARLLQYLASAYSGLAGLDTLNLLKVIDKLDESGTDRYDRSGFRGR